MAEKTGASWLNIDQLAPLLRRSIMFGAISNCGKDEIDRKEVKAKMVLDPL